MRRDCNTEVSRRGALDSGCQVADWAQGEQGQGRAQRCSCLGGFFPGDTSRQQDTHIGELRDICYPWHPWHDRRVRVQATLVKRGRAVARCSLEDVQPFRILEVQLWM